jgi:hypothetical protein
MTPSARAAGLLLAAAALACGGDAPSERSPMALGQTYTDWFYGGRTAELWERFTPELQDAFGAIDSLAAYRERTIAELGRETGAPREAVTQADRMQVYARVADFERAADPMLLEWAIDSVGEISGFVLRPAPPAGALDSAPAGSAQ